MIAGALVIGAGAAGLATALRLAEKMPVVLLCKSPLGSGAATAWAQGGIAAAMGDDDSPALHVRDTENVGGGLNDHHVVEILACDAAERIAELIALGTAFDRGGDGTLAFGARSRAQPTAYPPRRRRRDRSRSAACARERSARFLRAYYRGHRRTNSSSSEAA